MEDLAVSYYPDDLGSLTILIGDGAGGFRRSHNYAAGREPYTMLAHDLDQDGHLDLVCLDHDTSSLHIFLGDGSGGSSGGQDVPVGHAPRQMMAGQFDGDSLPDLAVSIGGDDRISLFSGNGDGTFVYGEQILLDYPEGIATADFDRDGFADIAACNKTDHGPEQNVIYRADGYGGWTRQDAALVAYRSWLMAAADWNADGAADLVSIGGGKTTFLRGDGRGGLDPAVDLWVKGTPLDSVVGDFDLDGLPDLAVVEYSYVTLYYNHLEVLETRVVPRVLNLRGFGRFIRVMLALPEGAEHGEIDTETFRLTQIGQELLLDEALEPVWVRHLGNRGLVAVFDRGEVVDLIRSMELEDTGHVELVVRGEFSDAVPFKGADAVRILRRGRGFREDDN